MSSEEDEIVQERRNMLKGLHPLMKVWYATEAFVTSGLKDKYGDFPLFWQDLETWPHTKLLKKIYLSVTERMEAGLPMPDLLELERNLVEGKTDGDSGMAEEKNGDDVIAPTVISVKHEDKDKEVDSKRPRKRSRWGVGSGDTSDAPADSGAGIVESKDTLAAISTLPLASQQHSILFESVEERAENGTKIDDAQSVPQPANQPPRKSRFSREPVTLPTGPLLPLPTPPVQIPIPTPEQVQQILVLKMQLQQANERLMTVAQDAAKAELDPNRSPSPPPRYDGQGKRTNTRAVRMRDALMQERGRLVEQLMKLSPGFAGPLDFAKPKPVRKLPIPAAQFPNQSFIGLIIGPRGNTQKRMEQETGCKISIKGKGMRGSTGAEEDEELHVHISGDDEAKVEQAAQMVLALLQPASEETLLAHKEKQLRELALINGTLREDEYCPVCGEKGHKQYECPARMKTFQAAGVKCSICGDGSHPTRDCPLKTQAAPGEGVLDSEYDSLMAELSGGGSTNRGNHSNSSNPTATVPAPAPATAQESVTSSVPPPRKQTVVHVSSLVTGLSPPPPMSTQPSALPIPVPLTPSVYGVAAPLPAPTTGLPAAPPTSPAASSAYGYPLTPAVAGYPASQPQPVYNYYQQSQVPQQQAYDPTYAAYYAAYYQQQQQAQYWPAQNSASSPQPQSYAQQQSSTVTVPAEPPLPVQPLPPANPYP